MTSRNKLCICQICTCGRHHCPHKSATAGPFSPCNISEYNNKYVEHPIEGTKSFKPSLKPLHTDVPLSDETTTKIDYVPHPLERPFVRAPGTYKKPEGTMEHLTSYQKEYVDKQGKPAESIKKREGPKNLAAFEGDPTYKHDYRAWDLPRQAGNTRRDNWVPPNVPFGGNATYSTDYIERPFQPQGSFKPRNTANLSTAPLSDDTDYRTSYVPHPLERKAGAERAQWTKPVVPFTGISTNKVDFTPKYGGKMDSCKPSQSALHSTAPMGSDTTMRMDYKPWEVEKPYVHLSQGVRKPEGDFDFNTSYQLAYHPLPLERQAAHRQAERKLNPNAEFYGITDYKDNYKPFSVKPIKHAGPNREYNGPSGQFDGQTTFKQHYVPHAIDSNRKNYKPAFKLPDSMPFDDATIYKSEYVPREFAPCPVLGLESAKNANFQYVEEDAQGHRFYQLSPRPVEAAAH